MSGLPAKIVRVWCRHCGNRLAPIDLAIAGWNRDVCGRCAGYNAFVRLPNVQAEARFFWTGVTHERAVFRGNGLWAATYVSS